MSTFNERMVIILFIGFIAILALLGAWDLFRTGKETAALAVLGLTTSSLALLAPSPLSKQFTPPDPAIDDDKDND